MTEKRFQAQVEMFAKLNGWLYYHTWNSRHSVAGFPDLVLVRGERLLFVELKTGSRKPTEAQNTWLEKLQQVPNIEVYLWRPNDWDTIFETLKRY